MARAKKTAEVSTQSVKKTVCPLTREQFLTTANAMEVTLDGKPLAFQAEVKEFSTGSFGWYLNGKATVTVDGKSVSVQIGANLIVVGSKEA